MQKLITNLDLNRLQNEINNLEFWKDGSGADMAFQPSAGLPTHCPEITKALIEIESLRKATPLHVMVNRLNPGIIVPKHRDFLNPTKKQRERPCVERWHLPVVTNRDSFWWDEIDGEIHMAPGFWHGFVPYWLMHTVWNNGTSERIHLVVDLDTERVGNYSEDEFRNMLYNKVNQG